MQDLPTAIAWSTNGTALAPDFRDATPPEVDFDGDVCLHTRLYSYRTDAGLVVGLAMNVMFTIDRPAKEVWPYFKDFNLWQNAYGHYYSGVLGDLEGKSYHIGREPGDPGRYDYNVIKVIPENLIVVSEPVPDDGSTGGISRGFHVFMLNDHGGKTVLTIIMEHGRQTRDKSEDEAIAYWRDMAPEVQRKWRDVFIPSLKKLIYKET